MQYVVGDLRKEARLSTKTRAKVVPTSQDLAQLFAQTWDPHSHVWRSAREVRLCSMTAFRLNSLTFLRRHKQRLNFDVAIKMLVYSASRPGEVVLSGAYKGTDDEDAMRWKVRLPSNSSRSAQLNRLDLLHRTLSSSSSRWLEEARQSAWCTQTGLSRATVRMARCESRLFFAVPPRPRLCPRNSRNLALSPRSSRCGQTLIFDGRPVRSKQVRLQLDKANPLACPVLPLLALALADGIFSNVPNLANLDSMQLETPVTIPTKGDVGETFVFRHIDRDGSHSDTVPAAYDWFRRVAMAVGGEIGWLCASNFFRSGARAWTDRCLCSQQHSLPLATVHRQRSQPSRRDRGRP